MNSPYMGKFKVSQQYKGNTHDGLDLVGIDSKEVHSTISGKVVYAGWENAGNTKQGFGQYVKIKQDGTNDYYYFGHLSEIRVRVGQAVKVTQVIGIEGSTGYSTGSHCHYCCRINGRIGQHKDISSISEIPNTLGGIFDDGFRGNSNVTYLSNTNYRGSSIVEALNQINLDSSFNYRKQLASKNSITNYAGTASQNTQMLNLLKQGKLIK